MLTIMVVFIKKGAPSIVKIVTCENGGTLLIDVDSIYCDCLPEYGGKHCEGGSIDNPSSYLVIIFLRKIS